MFEPLLTTKLHIPQAQPNLVPRERLVRQLTDYLCQSCRLVLLSAPAGYGKTTLIRDGIASLDRPVAWLSLDEDDNNAARFWTYLISAMQKALAVSSAADTDEKPLNFGLKALHMLEMDSLSHMQQVLVSLLNDLAALPGGLLLVLDDYHVISNPIIHEGVTFLLNHQPPQFCLIITTRADPPLPLSRLRARRQLAELRIEDLRFTTEEAADFLNLVMKLNLTMEEVAALETRTEGWIAGLQLAAFSMQGRPDVGAFIESFTGSHHYILEYLTEEVLQRQPAELQRFLLETAILTRLCAPLCDSVTGRSDSAEVLADLTRSNLFITPLDNEHYWFRYHHLFADLLRGRLSQSEYGNLPVLHGRAAVWYEENGYAGEAVTHALMAHDYRQASRIIINNWRRLFHQGWVNTAVRWLESLPSDLMRRTPPLGIAYCWTLSVRGDDGRLLRYIAEMPNLYEQTAIDNALAAENLEYRIVKQQILLLKAVTDRIRHDIPAVKASLAQMTEMLMKVSEQGSPDYIDLAYGAIYMQMGFNCFVAGDKERAIESFKKANYHSRIAGNILAMASAVYELAHLYQQQGCFAEAEIVCREALTLAEQPEYSECPAFSCVYIAFADLLREQKHFSEVEKYLQRGLELGRKGGQVFYLAQGYLAAARLHCERGAAAAALVALQTAQQLASTIENTELQAMLAAAAKNFQISQKIAATSFSNHQPLSEPLSERELEVLRLLCAGQSNREIAANLFITLDTVKRHVSNIFGKLGVSRRAQAMLRARELGIIE